MDQEPERIEKLKARIARLEKAVSNPTVEKLLLESTVEVYQEAYGAELSRKKWTRVIDQAHRKAKGKSSMDAICKGAGISRQAHYQHYQKKRRKKQEETQDGKVLTMVRMIRRKHPRMGTRKLLLKTRPGWHRKASG